MDRDNLVQRGVRVRKANLYHQAVILLMLSVQIVQKGDFKIPLMDIILDVYFLNRAQLDTKQFKEIQNKIILVKFVQVANIYIPKTMNVKHAQMVNI